MPLQNDVTSNSYVKVQRLFVSSKDRTNSLKGTQEYQIVLRDNVTNVIGIEVTGFCLPVHMAPSFLKPNSDFVGHDTVDFSLKAGSTVKTFSFAWPNLKYEYKRVGGLDYVTTLELLLSETIFDDSTFGRSGTFPVLFEVKEDYNQGTHIVLNTFADGISFLFASGPNEQRSAYQQMGFTKTDTPFSLTVQSPNSTQLTPFPFCDVFVQEFPELNPLKRIYFDKGNSLIVRNDPNISRTRFLSSQPNRILKTLTISLSLEGGIRAPNDLEHDLNFTVFCMQPEINTIPSWLNQSFVL